MPAARDTESAPLLPRRGDHNDGDIGDAPSSTDTGFLTRRWRKSAMKAAGILGATMVVAAIFSSSSGHVQHTMKGEQDLAAMERANVAAEVLDSAEGGTEAVLHTGVRGQREGEENPMKSSEPKAAQNGSKPNVFFIMIDDMGWNDIGYQTTDLQGVTPNLDKLAAGGIKMTNYYSMHVCTPARASLMTGRYVVRYGLQYGVIGCGAPYSVPYSEKMFPEYMKDAGYETHMIGKWHLGAYDQPAIPSQRGFDSFLGYLNGEETYWTHQSLKGDLFGRKFFDFGFGNASGYYDIIDRPLPDHPQTSWLDDDVVGGDDDDTTMLSPTTTSSSSLPPTDGNGSIIGQYSTQVFQDRAIAILEEKTPFDEEPLYMYLSHQAVHPPLGLPPRGSFSDEEIAILDRIMANSDGDGDGHLRQRFAKVLMYLDHTIGELVEYLEEEGWMENSIIVMASDNGGCYADGGSNYPLRGAKGNYWEGGNKVPAFMYSTSHIPEELWGTEYDSMMHVTDWLPTLASGAGIDLYGGAGPLDGVDQWDYMMKTETASAKGSPRQEMLYNLDPYTKWSSNSGIGPAEYTYAEGAFRSGKYKIILNQGCTGWYTFDSAILEEDPLTDTSTVCEGHPCSSCGGGGCGKFYDYLFDVEADPREENNLIDALPEVAETLRSRMVEVAFEEWMDSLFVASDTQSYYVWAKYNWWMVPWWQLFEGATEDPFGINSTTSSAG